MIWCRWSIFCLTLGLSVAGCSEKAASPKTATVKGKVTLDNTPLASGKIVFDATEPGQPPSELDIIDGAYSGTSFIGKRIVRISAYKTVPGPKGMTGPEYEKGIQQNYLPARYNVESKEVREVVAGTENVFDFELKSR